MKYSSCVSLHSLQGKLPHDAIKHMAKANIAKGMAMDAAWLDAAQQVHGHVRAEHARIVGEVRSAYEADGGKPRERTKPAEAGEPAQPSFVLGFMASRIRGLGSKLHEIFANPKVNLAAQFLTQEPVSERYKTQRPLAAAKDFLTNWQPAEYLQGELDDRQDSALKHFHATAASWNDKLRANFARSAKAPGDPFYLRDMLQYLYTQGQDGRLDLDENVKTGMSYAAYQAVLDMIHSPANLTDESIYGMHGMDSTDPVPAELHAMIGKAASMEDKFITDLGAVAVSALGLKARKDAPPDILSRLQSAMGTHIMALLEADGYIKREFHNKRLIEAYLGRPDETGEAEDPGFVKSQLDAQQGKLLKDQPVWAKTRYTYVSLVRGENDTLTEKAKALQVANAGSHGVIDKLFAADLKPKFATLVPEKFRQDVAKRTDREVSKAQAKVMQQTMDTPHQVIPAMWHLLQGMGREGILASAGFTEIDEAKVHKLNRDSVRAQNDNLANQYDLMMEMLESVDDPLEQQFYIEPSVWRNFRAGINTASLNQQSSKIHRFMFARPNWAATLDLTDQDMVNRFLIAVGNNLGVKTDKTPNAQTLAKVTKELASADIRKALDIITRGVIEQDNAVWTPANIQAVQEAAADREGMMTLQALVAVAHQEWAQVHGIGKIDITMLAGADGKTNGPMLTFLALGAGNSVDSLQDTLARGGFYPEGEDQPKHYSQWYAQNGQDLYEDLAGHLVSTVQDLVKTPADLKRMAADIKGITDAKEQKRAWAKYFSHFTQAQLDAVQTVTNVLSKDGAVTSAGRNLVKTPLTGFGFGSALKTASRAMENQFIGDIYKAIEDMAKGERKINDVPTTPEGLIKALNTLIDMANSKELKSAPIPAMSLEQLIDYELPEMTEQVLRKAFQRVVGKPTERTMDTYFATFQARRSALNMTTQSIYLAYANAYNELKASFMNTLMDRGEVAYRTDKNGVRVPLHDLTAEQEKVLAERMKPLLPVMNTRYSQLENNNLDAGLYLAKSATTSTGSPIYANEVNLAQGIPSAAGTVSKKFSTASIMTVESSPGVAGVPYNIHALDSANMHLALLASPELQALNVHDEIATGFHQVEQAAAAINQTTAENFLNFSPAREALSTFEKQMVSLASMVKNGSLSNGVVQAMYQSWADAWNKANPFLQIEPEDVGFQMMHMAVNNAYRADIMRLGVFAQMGAVDQYTWEGGQFMVTPEMRQQAKDMLKKVELAHDRYQDNKQTHRFKEAIKVLDAAYAGKAGQDFHFTDWIHDGTETGIESLDGFPVAQEQPGVIGALAGEVTSTEPLQKAEQVQSQATNAAVLRSSGFTAYGELGQSTIASDERLVKALADKPVMTVAEAAPMLEKIIGEGDGFSNYKRKLLRMAVKLAGDVQIHYVTSSTPEDALIGKRAEQSRGWYSTTEDGARSAIYVLSPEFKYSGLTDETLLHEIVHAALTHVIANPTQAAKPLVANLEKLLSRAREQVKSASLSGFDAALKDVHEFVAWGMSNQAFQDQVLKQITGFKEGATSTVLDGLRSFVRTLATMLGLGNQYNGLYVLIDNTIGLFATAAKVKSRATMVLSQQHSGATAHDMTTLQVYEALGQLGTGANAVDAAFSEHLKGLLGTIEQVVAGPFQAFRQAALQGAVRSALDLWTDARAAGVVPFAEEALSSGFAFSEQEAFALEQVQATLQAVLRDKEGSTTATYRELATLYEDARERVKPADLHPDPVQGQALHDFVFKLQTGANNESDYLARFAALGLANAQFNQALQFATPIKSKSLAGLDFADKLHALFERALTWIHGKLTNTFEGQEANEKLTSLVQQLVEIEQRKRIKLASTPVQLIDGVEQAFRTLSTATRNAAQKFGQSSFFQDSKNGFVKLAGTTMSMVAGNRVDQWMNALQAYRDTFIHEKNGVAMGIINEMRGAHDGNSIFYKLLRMTKEIERRRKEISSSTSQFTLASFDDGGSYLDEHKKAAISQIALRGDLQALLDAHGMDGIRRLVSDSRHLQNEIGQLESQLTGLGVHANDYINGARILGLYLATNEVGGENLRFNAGNIANMLGTSQANRVPANVLGQATPLIDSLASLYALQYADPFLLNQFKQVLQVEGNRGQGTDGIEMTLRLHRQLQHDSEARLFQAAGTLRTKGYLPEVYNPYIEMRVVEVGSAEAKELEAQGYARQGEVQLARTDPDHGRVRRQIYTLQDGGLLRYLSGMVSFTGMGRRGASIHNGDLGLQSGLGQYNRRTMQGIDQKRQAGLQVQSRGLVDPRNQAGQGFLVPVFNANGELVNYRYMMQAQTKDKVLQRDNRFEHLLGNMAASTFDKEQTAQQNRSVVEALHAQYLGEYHSNPKSYTMVGPDSNDPELREVWRLLPETTKQAVREVWGSEHMMVRFDLLDMIFGYRKLSITDPFTTPSHERTRFEQEFVKFFEFFMGKKARIILRRGEDIWQALVRYAKDTMVVKSGVTLVGNFTSNVSELVWFGVPLTDMWRHHRVALKGVMAYRNDSKELTQLQQKLDTGYYGNQSKGEVERRMVQLRDALARNPVRELVEAGMMPTIVEDVAAEDDPYSYEGRFDRKVGEWTASLNPHVVKAAKLVTMAHDTDLYKAMSYATQVSDFLARYTLYQHVMEREANPMERDKALQLVSDAFVNYDVPSHRKMQYANDVGLVYFSKYYLRIQKVIALLYRQNPGRALMLLSLGHFLDFMPMLTHSSVLHRFGNPFSLGAFEAVGAVGGDLMTVNTLMYPFR